MNSLQLVKFDMLSVLKSPLTYIAILLGVLPIAVVVSIVVSTGDEVDPNMILSMEKWFFSLIGMMFIVKTLSRDISEGTIQLYLNSLHHRIRYFVAKSLSIIVMSVLVTVIVLGITYIVDWTTQGPSIDMKSVGQLPVFYLMLFVIYGLLLFMFNLIVQKPAFVYTLGIFLLLFLVIVSPFIPLIPQIGPKLMEALNYIPIGYLTQKTLEDDMSFTNVQWIINVASCIILFVGNAWLIAKKDI